MLTQFICKYKQAGFYRHVLHLAYVLFHKKKKLNAEEE